MTRYNFDELTDHDFESLCHDLFEQELGVRLELFSPGRDSGIDLRHLAADGDSNELIVQCKRYQRGAWSSLRRNLLKEELPKVERLEPERYIVSTSVQMTPARKAALVADLAPWLRQANDVYGRDDIVALLGRYPEVERRHIKLWLTSTEVLDAVLHAGVRVRSEDLVNRLPRQRRLWAANKSFERAKKLLESGHVCLVAGPAGIGKTMLADILLADYAARGFEPVAISGDIEEADDVWRSGKLQVYHYDDFLGRVSLAELSLKRNEDARLISFFNRVRSDASKRLVLTTREYILNEARNRYSRLRAEGFELFTYVLDLSDYTRPVRAEILYNHLFYSGLPDNLRSALVSGRRYRDVISHRNYSPRIIEQVVSLPGVEKLTPDQFVQRFLATLDDPAAVWESMYDDLHDDARALLLSMVTLPTRVLLSDVRTAASRLLSTNFDSQRFERALRTIDGSFVTLRSSDSTPGKQAGADRVLAFRDPSVGDFLRRRVGADPNAAAALLDRAEFFEQVVAVWDITSKPQLLDAAAARALALLDSQSPFLVRVRVSDEYIREEKRPPVREQRVSFLATLAQLTGAAAATAALREALADTNARWERGAGDKEEALAVLAELRKTDLAGEEIAQCHGALLRWLTSSLDSRADWDAMLDLFDEEPDLVSASGRSMPEWAEQFLLDVAGEVESICWSLDQSGWVDEEAGRLEELASRLGVDIASHLQTLHDRVEELRNEEPDEDYEHDSYSGDEGRSDEDRQIDAMFDSLER